MKAYELAVRVDREGRVELPDALREVFAHGEVIRVIILVPEPTDSEEDAAWSHLTAEQFLAGYSDADSVYDRI